MKVEKDYSYPLTAGERDQLSPDYGGYAPTPHPDGKAWPKCCGSRCESKCAYRRDKSSTALRSRLGVHASSWKPKRPAEARFFCTHREADGYHRVCAGWAAFDKVKKP